MIIANDKEIDIFVASKIGSFKHIKYHTDTSKNSKKCIENLVDVKSLQKDDAITSMVWGNVEQTEILIGKKNQEIHIYNTMDGFTKMSKADFGTGDIVGLGRYKRRLLAALSSGVVQVWSKKGNTLINVGGTIDKMRVCEAEPTLLATGGEENDLKVWRIGDTEPVFQAKNLPHDWLQLRRPIWVSDLTFLSDTLLGVCSRHGYVRLYDTRAQRRPVCNVDFEMAATCIAPSFDERQVLVGFGRGQLHQVDLRVGRPDKGYKGAAGGITSVALSKGDRLVVSASLDRHLRVHEFESKQLIYKQYLTSKLSCVLAQTHGTTRLQNPGVEVKDEEVLEVKEEDEFDEIFENMETVGEESRKRHADAKEVSNPSEEGSPEDREDAIAKLLKSTEKKRRLEKRKKEKKAESVFHNA